MKKVLTLIILTLSLNASAFFTEIYTNQATRDSDNNGIFAYNVYSMLDPRWYAEEFISFVNTVETDVKGKPNEDKTF